MRVSAIIPAYNEEQTLGNVIDVVKKVPLVDEIVVISDGSVDRTAEIARERGVICIELEQNIGKGGAMKAGIDQADADVFVFLDADLIGLTPQHVMGLLEPVLNGEADMTIGVFEKGRVATDLAQFVAPYLSGQRAVKREILMAISGLDTARFGVEVALTRYIRANEVVVRYVTLENLTHRMKEEKLGILRGFIARIKMYWEIVKYTQQAIRSR